MTLLPIPGAPPSILCLRGATSARLKVEVEYGLKRGTTDNCYLLTGADATALVDVPEAPFAPLFAKAGEASITQRSWGWARERSPATSGRPNG